MSDSKLIFSKGVQNSQRKIAKCKNFSNNVIIINGFNGSGKTLLAPIVSSLPNVELMSFKYSLEWAAALFYCGDLTYNGFCELVKMTLDCHVYDQSMAREMNFRFRDLSSAMRSQKRLQYLSRLFVKGDDESLLWISDNEPITCLVTCHLLPIYPALKKALGERLTFVETVRDPLLMFEQLLILHKNTLSKNKEKDFTFQVHNGSFSRTYCDYYSDETVFMLEETASDVEKTVSYLERMFTFYMGEENKKLLTGSTFVPFEKFVLSPIGYLDTIADAAGTNVDKRTKREMKIQRVPRSLLGGGIKLPIYKRYSSFQSSATTLHDERQQVVAHVRSLMDNSIQFDRLIRLSEKYLEWTKHL